MCSNFRPRFKTNSRGWDFEPDRADFWCAVFAGFLRDRRAAASHRVKVRQGFPNLELS